MDIVATDLETHKLDYAEQMESLNIPSLTNLVKNGNFSIDSDGNGLADDWLASGNNSKDWRIENNTQFWTPLITGANGALRTEGTYLQNKLDHYYYFTADVTNVETITWAHTISLTIATVTSDGKVSVIFKPTSTPGAIQYLRFYGKVANVESSVTNVMLIDLPEFYGDAIPTKTKFENFLADELLTWFDGRKTIANIGELIVRVGNVETNKEEKQIFDPKLSKLIVPPKIFMVDEEHIKFSKSSMVKNFSDIRDVDIAIVSEEPNKLPFYKYIDNNTEIEPNDLGNTFNIRLFSSQTIGWSYGRSIEKVSKSVLDITNSTPKLLIIGDSITYQGVPTRLKEYLIEHSINPTMVGSINDALGTKNESIGSLGYANNTGQSTINSSRSYIESLPRMVKLATETDKTNHPDWCFRHSLSPGNKYELSYAQDIDKTGDFYIYDFANYLSVNSIVDPDIVIIAYGANDIMQYPTNEEGVAKCKLGLEIMISQIHAYNPNIKIGVIPQSSVGIRNYSDGRYIEGLALWNESAQVVVDNLRSSLSVDIEIVGVHMSLDRLLSYPSEIQTLNNKVREPMKAWYQMDPIHQTAWGTMEYAKVLSYYIINKI